MKKFLSVLLLLAMLLTVLSASAESSDMADVVSRGKLVVGITEFAPMDYKDSNGEWIGFDADLAKLFAQSLDIAVEFVEIDWDNKILELNNGFIDCVWNGMTLTSEVLSSMECSKPYANNSQMVVLPKDKVDQYSDVSALSALTFAVEEGSSAKAEVEALGYTFVPVSSQAAALMEVAAGTCDAAVIDALMVASMVGEGTGYTNLTGTFRLNDEEYGVGFRQGSDLAIVFNFFLKDLYDNGTLMSLAEKYGIQEALIDQNEL